MYQDFENIYGNLIEYIKQLGAEREIFKTKLIRTLILVGILVVVLIAIFLLYKDSYVEKMQELEIILAIVGVAFAIAFIVSIFHVGKSAQKYNKIFKTVILPNLLFNIDKNLTYTPKNGLSKEVYDQSGLAINYNQYSSEDYISGYIADNALLEMSEINAEEIQTNEKGQPVVVNSFNGILAVATLKKSVNNNIKIVKNSFWKGKREANIRIASIQFEKYFDMYADNKVNAMQIFTTDVIEEIIGFVQEMKIHLEISIIDNKFYIAFKTGQMYEGGITQNTKELLSKYYVVTYFMISLIKRINKAIEDAEL